MRVGFVEWPENLIAGSQQWQGLAQELGQAKLDILVTNELPFGPWIAAADGFDQQVAKHSVALHEEGLEAMKRLDIPAIISSRPVFEGERLANEAFGLEGCVVKPLHRKQYFPAEPGWFETEWYATQSREFEPVVVGGISVGVLLCTEVMFTEHARHYRRQGAELIVVPRATGRDTIFRAAGTMAAIVSGCYVVSSNRVGKGEHGPVFGGVGFACAPGGELLATTSGESPLAIIEFDRGRVEQGQKTYPCYVPERA